MFTIGRHAATIGRGFRSTAMRSTSIVSTVTKPPPFPGDSHSNTTTQLTTTRTFALGPKATSLTELIKQLRAASGAPMMECKKALTAEGVDLDPIKAQEWLRKHGSAKISKKMVGRDASDGMVGFASYDGGNKAALVKVSSETDFASRSESFAKLVTDLAATAAFTGKSEPQELMTQSVGGDPTVTVKDEMDDAILAIRENLQIVGAATLSATRTDSILVGYVHNKSIASFEAGTAAAMVELHPILNGSTVSPDEITAVGKTLAMHIVAASPIYRSPADIPAEVLEREQAILTETIAAEPKNAKKPPHILEKIVSGRMRKYYEEVCVLQQSHMTVEDNPKIDKYLQGLGLELVAFERLSIS